MKKRLRILFFWIILSLFLQMGIVSILNEQIQNVMGWTDKNKVNNKTKITDLKATIPSLNIENVQISYDNSYLAYSEKNTLKIFNLKKDKVVFEKTSPSATDKTLGVLKYQWLPDRNTLVFFYAKNTKTISNNSKINSTKPSSKLNQQLESETPNDKTPNTTKEPQIINSYINKQEIEFISVELPNSDEETVPKELINEFADNSEKIPVLNKIDHLAVSPTTNMTYFTIETGKTQQLLKINADKKVNRVQNIGNIINDMAVSDLYATLYINNTIGSVNHITAINIDSQVIIAKKPDYIILGVKNGKVYIGELKNNKLIKILTTDDLKTLAANPLLQTVWEGCIPFNQDTRKLIGANGQVIVYNNQTANIITGENLTEISLNGDSNYISADGTELVQFTKSATSTIVELKSLK